MSLTQMCRLCLSKDNLVWVFDKRFEDLSMKSVIFITTGVEIFTTDAISQSICGKCCHVIINMFAFRKKSLENDKQLKEMQKTVQTEDSITSLPTKVQIKEELDIPRETKKNVQTPIPIHHTVKELYDLYPQIKLQRMCLTCDVKPFVIMGMNEVENYYSERNLDFEEHCRLALAPRTTARKRTSSYSRAKYASPPCPINGQIIPPEVDDTEEGILRPIKIKIIPKISTTEKAAEKASDILESTEAKSDAPEVEKTAPCHRKRKYSDIMESPTKENEKPEDNHSTSSLESSKSLSYVANVSGPLYTCNICDAVHNNCKDFKRHRNKHLRCQFCRSTFRSLESKTQHLDGGCLVKKAMNNFPCLELPKVETNSDVVKKFPNAFADFYPAMNSTNSECYEILGSESETDLPPKPVEHATAENIVDIIEILSDDDDTSLTNLNSTNSHEHPPAKVPKPAPTIKPDVKVTDNPYGGLTSSGTNEIDMLKDLLNYSESLRISEDKDIQTDSPDSPGVEVDEGGQTAVLTKLKQQLHFYQVPIVIKKGQFSVSYGHKDKRKSKNMQIWNDLIPVDIKKNNKMIAATQHTAGDIRSLSTTEENIPVSTPTIVSRPIVENLSSVNLGISHTLVSKDSTINTCSKSGYDENYNTLPISEMTSVASVARPVSSTHSHISVVGPSATSALPSRNTTQSTCTKMIVDTCTKMIVDSPSNQSISFSANRTTTVVEWNIPDASRSHPCPQNIPRPQSAVEFRTYSASKRAGSLHTPATFNNKADKSLTNYPAAPTSSSLASYLSPPNTSVYDVPNVVRSLPAASAVPHKPIKFKIPQQHKRKSLLISKSSNVFGDNQKQNISKHSSEVVNGDSQMPPSTVVNKPKTKVRTSTKSRSSHTPISICKPVSVDNTFWPPASTFTVGASNVPISTNISQPVCLPHSATSVNGSNVSYATAKPKNVQFDPYRKRIDARRSSLPTQTFNSVPPPPYSVAVASSPNNVDSTLHHQAAYKNSSRENSFAFSSNAAALSQYSNAAKLPVTNYSNISNTVAASSLSACQISNRGYPIATSQNFVAFPQYSSNPTNLPVTNYSNISNTAPVNSLSACQISSRGNSFATSQSAIALSQYSNAAQLPVNNYSNSNTVPVNSLSACQISSRGNSFATSQSAVALPQYYNAAKLPVNNYSNCNTVAVNSLSAYQLSSRGNSFTTSQNAVALPQNSSNAAKLPVNNYSNSNTVAVNSLSACQISSRGNSFTTSQNAVALPQYSSNSANLPVNNTISGTVAVSCVNACQTTGLSTITQVNPTTCSMTTPQFGHIRVRNMQELI